MYCLIFPPYFQVYKHFSNCELPKLIHLNVRVTIPNHECLVGLACIMKACPSLQKLTLEVHVYVYLLIKWEVWDMWNSYYRLVVVLASCTSAWTSMFSIFFFFIKHLKGFKGISMSSLSDCQFCGWNFDMVKLSNYFL